MSGKNDGTSNMTFKDNSIKTANWCVTSQCNYNCEFCDTKNLDDEITEILDSKTILKKLIQLNIEKINIVGGEPLLYPFTYDIIKIAKRMGFVTSITTNGSLLTKSKIEMFSPYLDWIELSVDSKYEYIERKLGRGCGKHVENALKISGIIKDEKIKLKINTTVTKLNYKENMKPLIRKLDPNKWESLQVLHIKGLNNYPIRSLLISDEQFKYYINLNEDIILKSGENPVFECCKDMIDSYLMLSPHGNIVVNKDNTYERYPLEFVENNKDLKCFISVKQYNWRDGNLELI